MANKLGVSRQLLAAHTKKPDAPKLDDVAAWETYLAMHGREGSAPPELRRKIAEQRLRLLTTLAEREAIKLARERDETLTKGDVGFAISRGMALFFSALDRLVHCEAPPNLKGKTEREIETFLADYAERMKRELRESLSKLATEVKT